LHEVVVAALVFHCVMQTRTYLHCVMQTRTYLHCTQQYPGKLSLQRSLKHRKQKKSLCHWRKGNFLSGNAICMTRI